MHVHYTIETILPNALDAHLAELADLLHVNVLDGASVSFVLPFDQADAAEFWQKQVKPSLARGVRTLLVAKVEGELAGCVMLDYDMPRNQPHRAEIAKLLVHPKFRRLGIARALMVEVEQYARELKRSLLVLDTASDGAERLYGQLGYKLVGSIPQFAYDSDAKNLEATQIMYKQL